MMERQNRQGSTRGGPTGGAGRSGGPAGGQRRGGGPAGGQRRGGGPAGGAGRSGGPASGQRRGEGPAGGQRRDGGATGWEHRGARPAGAAPRSGGRRQEFSDGGSASQDGRGRASSAGRLGHQRGVTDGGRGDDRRTRSDAVRPGRGRDGESRRPGRTGRLARPVGPKSRREGDTNTATDVEQNNALVVGRHPVLEALKSGRSINKILLSESAEGGSLAEIMAKAKAAGVVIQRVPKAHLDTLTPGGNHQGIVAYTAAHDYVELEEIISRETGQDPLVLLLDEVSDPYNLGAVLRTAEATGVQGVVIPKRRAVPLTETVGKAAAGAMEYVPVARVANLVQAMETLKNAGYWIVGTDVEGTKPYTEVPYQGPIAIVIGAEGKGLSRLVRERCDYLVSLPMLGKLQSLNASVATGVLLYEVVRQRS